MMPVGCNRVDSRGPQFSSVEYTFFLPNAGYCVGLAGQCLSDFLFFRYDNDVRSRKGTDLIA